MRQTFNIIEANNGKQALEILEKTRIDLIVTDLMMPEMNGMELCKKVKGDIGTSHIPVIILTASTNMANQMDSYKYGAEAYVEKPVKPALLKAQINSILANRKRNTELLRNSPNDIYKIYDAESEDAKFLNSLNNFIDENISNPELDIESICEAFLLGRTTMFNKIKSLCGVPPKEYVKLIRLNKAAELLVKGEFRINEVGYLVGFNTPSYFSKCFMKQFGVLPGDFVKNHKQINQQ